MNPRLLVLLGGGEHARVVGDAARSRPGEWELVGLVDPAAVERTRDLLDIPHLGDDEALVARFAGAEIDDRPWLIVAAGAMTSPAIRRRVAAAHPEGPWATVVHASAWVSPSAELGPGTVVLAGATVNAGAVVGPHAIINTGAIVEHDVRLGAFVQVAPGAVIGGGATIGAGAFIGLGAGVRDHVTIGEGATVGMGAVVVADVQAGVTVMGVPARPLAARS